MRVVIYSDNRVEIDGKPIDVKHVHVSAGNGHKAEVTLIVAAERVVRRSGEQARAR